MIIVDVILFRLQKNFLLHHHHAPPSSTPPAHQTQQYRQPASHQRYLK